MFKLNLSRFFFITELLLLYFLLNFYFILFKIFSFYLKNNLTNTLWSLVVQVSTDDPFLLNILLRHDCSDCRRVRRFKVGQNLYQSFNTRKVGPNWRKAIDSWYTEIQQFPISSVQKYKFNHKTGHYSQLVWAKTTRVGCGSITYR